MVWNTAENKDTTRYEVVHLQDQVQQKQTSDDNDERHASIRADDSGAWNAFKAWYLFLIHLMTCIFFFIVMVQWVNGRDFKTGSPPSNFFGVSDLLYQTQVTGLISLALVIIRLMAGTCSALLVWRTIFIILEKRGMTLSELLHLSNYRVPIIPRRSGVSLRFQFFWSCWGVAVVVLLWPSGFVAPLVTSSVAWIPSIKLSDRPKPVSMRMVGQWADWSDLLYKDLVMTTIANAASMAGVDPGYAFDIPSTKKQLPLRRYFFLDEKIPAGSKMELTLPYFEVDSLRWIDAASDNRSQFVNNPKYSDLASLNFEIRVNGSVSVVRDGPWDAHKATPKAAETFFGKSLISIKVGQIEATHHFPDGSSPNRNTSCFSTSEVFGKLPDVGQHNVSYWFDNNTWAGTDCFLVAKATFRAGKYKYKDCVVFPAGTRDYMATCYVTPDPVAIECDWISGLAMDFMSETMKYVAMLNYTHPWMQDNLNNYTTSMLTLGYQAAWSALMHRFGNDTEPATVRKAEPVVYAAVNRTRVLIWLVMSATLSISAVLVAVAQSFSMTNTVDDPTLAPLLMDLFEVMHVDHTSGPCSAVELKNKIHKLPRLQWTDEDGELQNNSYHRRIIFATSSEDQ